MKGRVLKSFGNRFLVATSEGTYDCTLRGRIRLSEAKTLTPVAVGDDVELTVVTPPHGVIDTVLPRRNKLSRPDVIKPEWEQILVANCDQIVVVASIVRPRLRYGAIDRFLLAGEKAGLRGLVVLNKTDLVSPESYERAREVYASVGYPVVVTSAVDGRGVPELREHLRGLTSIFAGHSGVGKSSLINALEPGLQVHTRDVSLATERGVHTTTAVELHTLSFGGYIADTPGLRAIGLWALDVRELPRLYRDFVPYLGHCRFGDCAHVQEPGCGIRRAVEEGQVAPERYDGYVRIRESLLRP